MQGKEGRVKASKAGKEAMNQWGPRGKMNMNSTVGGAKAKPMGQKGKKK